MKTPQGTILAVDDEPEGLYALEELLRTKEYRVLSASSGEEALEQAASHSPDLILLDINLPGIDGYEVTKRIKSDPRLRFTAIVLLTAKSSLEDITYGLECGADGYLVKPYRKEELLSRVHAALRTRSIYLELRESIAQNQELRSQLVSRASFAEIIGNSAAMQKIYAVIEKIKASEVPVLITGESGTGKELLARAVHVTSPRAEKTFLALNCSAFNENLLESELFGYVRGAFSGAVRDKPGLFEAADGGTIFLDELGEMALPLQAKLLRVLQDGSYMPVGSITPKRADVRVIAATNRDLAEMIAQEKFRKDLFYRINVIPLHLPALRERRSDIALLADYFLAQNAKRGSTPKKSFSEKALELLLAYEWPGNIRELENEVAKAALLSGDSLVIETEFLSGATQHGFEPSAEAEKPGGLKESLDKLERELIARALDECRGNRSQASIKLGISRTNLIKKIQLFGLT